MNIDYRILLDCHKDGYQAIVPGIKCGDSNTRTLYILLSDSGQPVKISENAIATIFVKKENGETVYGDCSIENDKIVHSIKTNEIDCEGEVLCECRITTEDKALTTAKFKMFVEEVLQDDSAIEAQDSFTALTETLKRVVETEQDVAEALEAASEAQNLAQNALSEAKEAQENAESALEEAKESAGKVEEALERIENAETGLGSKIDKVYGDEGNVVVFGKSGGIADGGMKPSKVYVVPYYSSDTIAEEQKEEIRGIITEIAAEKGEYALFMKLNNGIIPASYIDDYRYKTVRATLHDESNISYQIVLSRAGEVTVSRGTIYVMEPEKIERATSKAPTGAAMASYVQDYVAEHGGNVSEEELAAAIEAYFEENPIVTEETDPTVFAWAKEPTKPTYTASEVGALPANTVIPTVPTKVSAFENDKGYLTKAPVTSVNGKTGAVSLSASDVKALPDTYTPPDQTAAQVGADAKGTADAKVSAHNTSNASHNDIRLLIEALTTRLNTLANSTDEDLDQLSEIVAYIKSNKSLIDGITTSKVSVSDIINNLTTNVASKPLSAAQGVALKALIDAITVPTKVSAFDNDAGYIKSTELNSAVDDALEEAKESGEFDGDRGFSTLRVTTALSSYTTTTGGFTPKYRIALSTVLSESGASEVLVGDTILRNYYTYRVGYVDSSYVYVGVYASIRGSAGTSVTISSVTESEVSGGENVVTFSDDKTLTIKNGRDGEPGSPGIPGDNGKTPVKGVDYDTPEDRAEIEAYIASELAKRGQLKPEYANSIDECTDTSKMYVLPDGMIYAYMSSEVPGGEPLFTNKAKPTSSDWKADSRFSSSSGSISSCTGAVVTNAIAAKTGDTIRVKGLRNGTTAATGSAYVGIVGYTDASGSTKAFSMPMTLDKTSAQHGGGVKDLVTLEGDVIVYPAFKYFTGNSQIIEHANSASVVCIRVSGEPVTTVDDIIVTVNEKIEYSAASTGYDWASTGLAFVPADYEDRIIDLEEDVATHTAKITALEKAVETGGTDESETQALKRIKEWDKPVYDPAPVTLIADDRAKPALTTSDRTIDGIYAKYRALMAAYPDYITETNMGKSTASSTFTAIDMLRFDFKERDGLTQPGYGANELHETKPKIIFLSGIHNEWVGVWGLYYALEEIVTNPDFDDIRRNAHIIVIPCANPYGLVKPLGEYSVPSHVNANGVAIHNNFGAGWVLRGNVGEYNYSGTEPYSELETQYIDAVMAENPDAVAFVSCHNNDYSTYYESPVIWASSATYHMCNVAFRLIDKISKAWLDKYGDTLRNAIDAIKINMDANDYRLGRACMSTSAGTEQLNATKYGIQGVNLEISRMMKVFSGNTDGTSEVMTHGAEVYANFMRTLLWSYDHKDKKEYAPNLPWSE